MRVPPAGRVEVLNDEWQIHLCAQMMSRSDPWHALFFSEEECEQMLREQNIVVHGWISEEEGLLAGFMATAALGIGSEPLLEFLCVNESGRNLGIGSALMAMFEDILFPNADNLYLFVSDINPDAVRLYERLGYRRIGELPDFNLVGQTEYFYRKTRRPRQELYHRNNTRGRSGG